MSSNSVYAHTGTRLSPPRAFLAGLAIVLAIWVAVVVWASLSGSLALIPPFGVVATVAAGIAVPTLIYAWARGVRRGVGWIGLRGLTAFHIWRIPAALVFFWYGTQGALPLVFVVLAGVGDLLAGLLALWVVTRRVPSRRQYAFAHLFGLADFVVAVGTGVTLTLLADPLMATVQRFPVALIPFFGVALSGATHLMALHLLARRSSREV